MPDACRVSLLILRMANVLLQSSESVGNTPFCAFAQNCNKFVKEQKKTNVATLSPLTKRSHLLALDQYSIEKKRFTGGQRRVRECWL